jgi:uncharacterized RDD family membrane protein YckC
MAEWWQRLVAFVIDILVLGVPNSIIVSAVGGSSLSSRVTSPSMLAPRAWEAIGLAFVVSLGYFSFLDGGRAGQTVGKRVMGIAVRDLDSGGPIGAGRALARRVVFFAFYFGFGVLFVINALSPLWDRQRRAWHDKAARSCVVSLR